MHSILLASQFFYAGNTSLLVWLNGLAVPSLFTVIAGWMAPRRCRWLFTGATSLLCGLGIAICLAMAGIETVIFEFGSPLCVIAYLALLAAFVWLMRLSRSERPRKLECAASFLLAGIALTYLFVFGAIPRMVELEPEAVLGIEGPNVLGRNAGTLSITEFADFECAPCAMQDQVMEKLWHDYADRIRYSFRHFPKQRHAHAAAAALASQCASEPGRFWQTKQLLFANQDRLGELLANSDLPTIPAADAAVYARCVQTRSAWDDVSRDMERAKSMGLTATPSIIVGNTLLVGVVSYPRLALIVRRELEARKLPASQRAGARANTGCGATLAEHACVE